MRDRDTEYQAAIARWDAAVSEFEAASSVINAQMLVGLVPTAAALLAEDQARTRLVIARRQLFALPWDARRAELGAHEAQDAVGRM
jgi:hypothetical protein